MKIVVLDGYTLNPGDLSWEGFGALGEFEVYDRTPAEAILERARGAEIVLTNKTALPRETIEKLPELRYIGVLATGYDVVDIRAARQRSIPVTNVPSYGTRSVAQMVFAHILNFTQRVAGHGQSVREGRWSANPDFCYWEAPLVELEGLTMGVVGLGRIGQAVAALAKAFGMRVLAHDVQAPASTDDVEMVSLDRLLAESDVVSLHCPLTAENRGLINADRLATMKRSALLINTARGPLVEQKDLADALNEGRLAGAGLDVLDGEPPARDNPLLHARNCVITPHIAWATRAARQRLMDIAVDNLRGYLAGTCQNVVNP